MFEGIKIRENPHQYEAKKNQKAKDLYITFDVPNDGKFKVLNTIELQRFKANIEKRKGFTENQKPVKSHLVRQVKIRLKTLFPTFSRWRVRKHLFLC